MKKLLIFVVLAALAYCAYWFAAARILPGEIETQIQTLTEDTATITHGPIKISGFPAAFKSDVSPVKMAGEGWSADIDMLTARAPAYLPTSVKMEHEGRAAFNIENGLFKGIYTTQTETATLDSSLTSRLSQETVINADNIQITAAPGSLWPVQTAGSIYMRRDIARKSYAVDFNLKDITLDASRLGDIGQLLGPRAQGVSGDILITREAASETPFGAQSGDVIAAQKIVFNWGELNFDGRFNLTRNNGVLSGNIMLLTEDPAALIKAAQREGMIPRQASFLLDMLISSLPKNDVGQYELPIIVTNGDMMLGPLPLGRLPF